MIEVTDEMRNVLQKYTKGFSSEGEAVDRIIELHEANKPKPEPVAYRWWNQGCNCDECDQYFYSEDPDFISKNREPLYTAPPTREPLSEDKLDELINSCSVRYNQDVYVFDNSYDLIQFARAVEQAHGIG